MISPIELISGHKVKHHVKIYKISYVLLFIIDEYRKYIFNSGNYTSFSCNRCQIYLSHNGNGLFKNQECYSHIKDVRAGYLCTLIANSRTIDKCKRISLYSSLVISRVLELEG